MSGEDTPRQREVAYRLFAAEFDDADLSFAESDEERAPNYVVTPTGARINRVFVVGVLTAVEQAGEDILRARVVDPTGAFVVYAGQYQPEAQTFFERAEPPMFVAVSGKARTFQPDDSDTVYTSIRPESVNEVDAETRDRWTVQAAEQTLDRVGTMAAALQSGERGEDLQGRLAEAGVDEPLAAGIPLAIDHYGTTGAYLTALRALALDAARVVAGDIEEVDSFSAMPGAGDDADLAALAATGPDLTSAAEPAGTDPEPTGEPTTTGSTAEGSAVGTAGESDTATTDDPSAAEEGAGETGDAGASSAESSSAAATAESTTGESSADASTGQSSTAEPTTVDGTSETTTEKPSSADASSAGSSGDTPGGADAPAGEDTLGEFEEEGANVDGLREAGEEIGESTTTVEDDVGDFDPGEFELDEDEREEIESEFGTEFQSGTDVDDPGEADIETPDPEAAAAGEAGEPAGAADAAGTDEAGGAPTGSAATTPDADDATSDAVTETPETATPTGADETAPEETAGDAADEPAAAGEETPTADTDDADVDLPDAVMDAMADLDDGSGADREELVASVVETTGADAEAVEDAIQDALMDGRCYEPADGTLKPI